MMRRIAMHTTTPRNKPPIPNTAKLKPVPIKRHARLRPTPKLLHMRDNNPDVLTKPNSSFGGGEGP
jgi:hypothetical protein